MPAMKGTLAQALVAALACVLALAACASPARVSHAPATVSSGGRVPLVVAMRTGHDLGPTSRTRRITFEMTLANRDPAGLQALLASGRRVTPAEYAARFGPDPARVAAVARVLAAAQLSATWRPGDVMLEVSGGAAAVERFLHVSIHDYVAADGTRFYAARSAPALSRTLHGTVIAITGLDDYARGLVTAIPAADANGVTPRDMTGFYDINPLRSAGLDGSGQTVVFIEWGVPSAGVLNAYSQKFGLSPFNVDVRQDAAAWGSPFGPNDKEFNGVAGEASLDIEVVHGIAPGAREVVYQFGTPSAMPLVLKTIATQFPGAIISSSISDGACEKDASAAKDMVAFNQEADALAAQGMSIYIAAGDRGAYACLPDYPSPDPNGNTEITVDTDSDSTGVTAVGGTTAFLAQNGGYFQEAAWGEPAEQWGGGGGVSTLFTRPAWQQAPGVPANLTGRGVPDVSADADSESGWDIFEPSQSNPAQPQETTVGGTSAAAPFWAAITALIDQNLAQKGLRSVGFANPALYQFAQSPSGLPAPAFHDIALGTNLHYAAGSGWDMATGLGTPDVAALADDFTWFEQNNKGNR